MKKSKPRIARTELVPVRRSLRFSNKSAPQYQEVLFLFVQLLLHLFIFSSLNFSQILKPSTGYCLRPRADS